MPNRPAWGWCAVDLVVFRERTRRCSAHDHRHRSPVGAGLPNMIDDDGYGTARGRMATDGATARPPHPAAWKPTTTASGDVLPGADPTPYADGGCLQQGAGEAAGAGDPDASEDR